MPGIPWTKFQDFYLRLGFLKVLVLALSPARRSATNDSIYAKLKSPLFDHISSSPRIAAQADHIITWYKREDREKKLRPYVLEGMLVGGGYPSWLFAITQDTVYKILDWGHDVQFVGRGNQITERGLLLRSFLPDISEEFFHSDGGSWNPFPLTPMERLYFLFHLGEIDQVTITLIDLLAEWQRDTPLQSSDAAQLTCRALFDVLKNAETKLSPRNLPQFRVAYDLALAIAEELDMTEFLVGRRSAVARRIPKPPKALKRFGTSINTAMRRRKAPKNADHQTIPRFEQLVDLGFLTKPTNSESSVPHPQKRWAYYPTERCIAWKQSKARNDKLEGNWLWNGFAAAAVAARVAGNTAAKLPTRDIVVDYFARAYESVRRPIGHTPLESVALRAMLDAAVDGCVIEMRTFHKLMLEVKQNNLLPDHAFFASGNDLDTMFINLRKGYHPELQRLPFQFSLGEQVDE